MSNTLPHFFDFDIQIKIHITGINPTHDLYAIYRMEKRKGYSTNIKYPLDNSFYVSLI